jgi:hypothetical protein
MVYSEYNISKEMKKLRGLTFDQIICHMEDTNNLRYTNVDAPSKCLSFLVCFQVIVSYKSTTYWIFIPYNVQSPVQCSYNNRLALIYMRKISQLPDESYCSWTKSVRGFAYVDFLSDKNQFHKDNISFHSRHKNFSDLSLWLNVRSLHHLCKCVSLCLFSRECLEKSNYDTSKLTPVP